MAKKRLLVDMDGTLARFHDEDRYLERMFEKDFFRELQPFENMVEGIRQFMADHPDVEVFIVSARVIGEPPYCEVEKNAWLDRYLPEVDKAHRIYTDMGRSKAEYLPGGATKDDYLLDDYNKGLNLFMYDGGSAIKCHNNINQRGLGAYGGRKGQLWVGPMVHVEDKPELIAAELAQHMGLDYDLNKVVAAYDNVSYSGQELTYMKDIPNKLDLLRTVSGQKEFATISVSAQSAPENPVNKVLLPQHTLEAICINEYGSFYAGLRAGEENPTEFYDTVCAALKESKEAIVGQVHQLSISGVVGTQRFHTVAAMLNEIRECEDTGVPIKVEWNITPPQRPMKDMSLLELEDKFFYEYGYDQTQAYEMSTYMKTPAGERRVSDTRELESCWVKYYPKDIKEPIHQFLGFDSAESYVAWCEKHGTLLTLDVPAPQRGLDQIISQAKEASQNTNAGNSGQPTKNER